MRQSLGDVIRGLRAFHGRQSLDDVLSAYSGPVHVVAGAEDALPGLTISTNQVNLAQNGRLHVIPDCGQHYVPMERPEALNMIIRRLIDQIAD